MNKKRVLNKKLKSVKSTGKDDILMVKTVSGLNLRLGIFVNGWSMDDNEEFYALADKTHLYTLIAGDKYGKNPDKVMKYTKYGKEGDDEFIFLRWVK